MVVVLTVVVFVLLVSTVVVFVLHVVVYTVVVFLDVAVLLVVAVDSDEYMKFYWEDGVEFTDVSISPPNKHNNY